MNRYQLLIEYVGTNYIGWQSQKNGKSIQNTVQSALSKLLKEKITLNGAGTVSYTHLTLPTKA